MNRGNWTVASILLIAISRAWASSPCDGVDRSLTAARQHQYAALIVKTVRRPHIPSDITVTRFMQSGPWSVAWGESKDFEPGVFFFHRTDDGLRFAHVWGGWAVPDDRPQLIKWVHSLGENVPNDLADCFAETVTAGH
jgi:hypothetical protein